MAKKQPAVSSIEENLGPYTQIEVAVPFTHPRYDAIQEIVMGGISASYSSLYTDPREFLTDFSNGGSGIAPTASGFWKGLISGARTADLEQMAAKLQTEFSGEPTFTAAMFAKGKWFWTCDVTLPVPATFPQYLQWYNGIHGNPPMRPWVPSEQPVTFTAILEAE